MKNLILCVLIVSVSAFAQMGLGWSYSDWSHADNQAKLRFDLNPVKLDLGLGFRFVQDENNTPDLSISGFGVIPIHDFSQLTGNIAAGAVVTKRQAEDDVIVEVFGGYQPELLFWEHLIISTQFGLTLRSTPDLELEIVGPSASILEGLTIMVLF